MNVKTSLYQRKNLNRQDYRIYSLSKQELLKYSFCGFALGSLFFWFFYHSWLSFILGIPCSIAFCQYERNVLCEKRKRALESQFMTWIKIASTKLHAGYSVENAFMAAGKEMEMAYGNEAEDICREIREMARQLDNNVTFESCLLDLGERSSVEDIGNFAEVFATGKRSGGNLSEMIESCCEIIMMKQETENEIRTLLHGRAFEQKIMCVIPFGIVGYISISSPGYFDVLYHNTFGIAVMTVCMVFYLFGVWLSCRVMHIEV